MKKEDRKINYRPELEKQLRNYLMVALDLYDVNYQKLYYLSFAKAYKNEGRIKECHFLEKVADCFEEPFPREYFDEHYRRELLDNYNLKYVSPAQAASFIFSIYKTVFKELEDEINIKELTKMEKYMVHDFFWKLAAPMRNPNIEVQEGQTKCWYDDNLHASFKKDLTESMRIMEHNCTQIINIFSIPDEMEYGEYSIEK